MVAYWEKVPNDQTVLRQETASERKSSPGNARFYDRFRQPKQLAEKPPQQLMGYWFIVVGWVNESTLARFFEIAHCILNQIVDGGGRDMRVHPFVREGRVPKANLKFDRDHIFPNATVKIRPTRMGITIVAEAPHQAA
jgi:hypothetical protein